MNALRLQLRRTFAATKLTGMLSILCVWLLLALPARAEDPLRVLFIGNSYTSVNDLPQVFCEVAKSAGRKAPTVKSSTPGGRTLLQHMDEQASLELIDEGAWDVVVLQGQSRHR